MVFSACLLCHSEHVFSLAVALNTNNASNLLNWRVFVASINKYRLGVVYSIGEEKSNSPVLRVAALDKRPAPLSSSYRPLIVHNWDDSRCGH
jgi:hypothetical protein